MTEDCLFCQIVAGDIPSHTVYEDEDVYAFLDVNPLARGHTLVIPKTHHERVNDLSDSAAAAVGAALPRVATAVEAAVDAPATTIGFNNGTAAGQEVPHTHAHVVPRFEDDGVGTINMMFRTTLDLDDEEMADLADEISASL
jgi:histidine triad (HIT) family protein